MRKIINVGTIGHIDYSRVLNSVYPVNPKGKILARKKKKLLRELARRKKRLDKLTQK